MRLPVVICSHDRYTLLKQTIESLRKNSDFELQIIVSDASDDKRIWAYCEAQTDLTYYHFRATGKIYGPPVGQAKMKGADLAEPSDYIYFTDDDIYFLPHWDSVIIEALEKYEDLCIVGGRNVHSAGESRPLSNGYQVGITGQQTGYSMMWRRPEWDKWGYFPNYNEDSWISFETKSHLNKKIGTIDEPVVLHCGYWRNIDQNNDAGSKTVDWQDIEVTMKNYPELVYE